MVNKIVVECSLCHQVSDLFLSTGARIVIFNCPSCWAPVLYYNEKIYILTDKQIDEIVNNASQSNILQVLNRITAELNSEQVHSHVHGHEHAHRQLTVSKVPAPSVLHHGRGVISNDDVLNLRIELENCMDVSQFVSSL